MMKSPSNSDCSEKAFYLEIYLENSDRLETKNLLEGEGGEGKTKPEKKVD
jgi:hypothetical protein